MNGLLIHILTLILVLTEKTFNAFNDVFIIDLLLIVLASPLMIFIYDYLINPKRLNNKCDWYYLSIIIISIVELSFFGINLNIIPVLLLPFQVALAVSIRRRKLTKKPAILYLLILPSMLLGFFVVYLILQYTFRPIT